MSRQRKRDAVLRLLRGEDLESVSRSLGVTAATLSGWRDAFLAAGEASLSTRSTDGDALESGRLKAKLGEMLIERPAGGRGHELGRLAFQRHSLWADPSLPDLGRVAPTVHRHLSPARPEPSRRPGPVGPMPDRRCWRRSAPSSPTAPSKARVTARPGRCCATRACAPPSAACCA
jgi:hypothetical protein